ncbi:hypothetical protein L198_00729 [Cryptococcus wingfieldii CBS 7118]|uniref:Protein CPL1-like domain-containing protein n=1 Tax=Cryptococcus wingfieldii CBS 7118 TaxID=1295528 RepID=A0A1E3K1Z1_9TREE|nr:hypothetical protein L198_00729 [Cryptococcus wingfieldii CBS 7118]ODO07150.1 hypothetical protein L198_00729 [Cryptococcus wingfieldii CBS 7118]
MFFSRLITFALVSLSVTTLAIPTSTTNSLLDSERYHEDHRRHHPSSGTNSHASASASGVKRKATQTAVATFAVLGAATDLARCPVEQMACPITSLTESELAAAGDDVPWECISPQEDLYSCGGCATLGTGIDCTAIAGVDSVSCTAGTCLVHSCQSGFLPTSDLQACNVDSNTTDSTLIA